MSIKGQGHYLTLVKGHSDFKVKCLTLAFGWPGGAMVLDKLPVLGSPTIRILIGQGPIALAVGAGGGVWTFLLSSIFSLLFLPLSGRRPHID